MKLDIDAHSADEAVIVMRRTFDAPRDVVWAALTDPKHVAKWYGGHGFENPVCEMDVRPGGRWRHVMRTPDGVDHEMEFVFVEVVRPERLVWRNADHGKRSENGYRDNIMTVTLEEAGRQTRWKLVTRFTSIANRDLAVRIGFTTVLGEGTEKFNDLVKALSVDPKHLGSRA
jgi:uncharacterized protein YndB with AHSA1/START domain